MSALDRLAELVGIEPFYWDIFGNRRETSAATKRALIEAMGLSATTDAEVEASLKGEDEGAWRTLVPPSIVGLDTQIIDVPFYVGKQNRTTAVTWTLREENGAVETGTVAIANLRETATREIDGQVIRQLALPLPRRLAMGYHDLDVRLDDASATCRLIVAPERAMTIEEVAPGARTWGIGLQLYSLRSASDWGIGDFDDLGRFAEESARLGAGLVGLNPLHQLFLPNPELRSPYSPSSRAGLNILYIDVEAVPEYQSDASAHAALTTPAFQARLAAARDAAFVDYTQVAALKLEALTLLHQVFCDDAKRDPGSPRARDYQQFIKGYGASLRSYALFDTLQEHFAAKDAARKAAKAAETAKAADDAVPGATVVDDEPAFGWHGWPEAYHDPDSAEVAAFAKAHADRFDFFMWAQFEADRQFCLAAERGRRAGLSVGFYRDLAVAVNPGGSAVWADRKSLCHGVSVGSPPDAFNLMGQNWGLAPLSPLGLRKTGYRAFIRAMRANMRHAAALRIDHVMALKHLFWLPDSGEPGAYVRYPFEDMLRIVALESRRAGCAIIGEDLGTVPDGFRPALAQAGVLSYRVLYFERNYQEGTYLPPAVYPKQALATVTTHDLATFRGFWTDRDLDWRRDLGLYPDDQARNRDKWDRGVDRWRLLQALNAEGLRPARYPNDEGAQPWSRELAEAVHEYLSRSPAQIVMLQIEDGLSEFEQPNLPGTVDQHPNWRRRLPVRVETIGTDEGVKALAAAVRRGRDRR